MIIGNLIDGEIQELDGKAPGNLLFVGRDIKREIEGAERIPGQANTLQVEIGC